MPTDNVRTLPGVYRPELEENTPPATALRSALDAGIKDVVIVGRLLDGEIAVFSSSPDGDAVLGLMARGTHWLAERRTAHDDDSQED